jgi:hypothetical protein
MTTSDATTLPACASLILGFQKVKKPWVFNIEANFPQNDRAKEVIVIEDNCARIHERE